MFSDNEVFGIEKAKEEIKSLIRGRQLLWNGITRNVVIAGGFFTAALQLNKFKDIDIFILNNDFDVFNNLTQGRHHNVTEWSRSELVKYNHNPEIVDVINNNVTKAQYILTKYKTREELLEHFDFKHCKVSYAPKEDKLYINRETFDCITNKVLKVNNEKNVLGYRNKQFLEKGWVTPETQELREKQSQKSVIMAAYEKLRDNIASVPPGTYYVPSHMVTDDNLEAFKQLDDMIPRPAHRAVGEERAWGKRLARRFGVDSHYDEQSFVVKANGQSGFLDHETSKPDKVKADIATLFAGVDQRKGGSLVVHGWVMAEDLVKLGAR